MTCPGLLESSRKKDSPGQQVIIQTDFFFWLHFRIIKTALIISGFTQNETLKNIDENWDSLAPVLLKYQYKIPKEQRASVAQKIRKHYFGRKSINRDNLHILTNLVSDRMFGASAVNVAKAQAVANKSPVFFSYYDYRATDSYSNWITKTTENLGE